MSQLFVSPFVPALGVVGQLLPGAKLYFYLTGTMTLTPVYADSGMGTPLENPVQADITGRFPAIYLDPDVVYRVRMTDAAGLLVPEGDIDPCNEESLASLLAADDGYKFIGGAVTYVSTRTILATYGRVPGRVIWLDEGLRVGFFRWLVGDYSAQVTSDPLQGLYVPSSTDTTGASGAWGRIWDGTNGRPEWFGAVTGDKTVDNRAAINACVALCQTTQFGSADYYIADVFQFAGSGKRLIGAAGSRDGPGTRIILTGANVVSSTVFQYGPTSAATQNDCANKTVVKGIAFVRDCSTYTPRASSTTDAVDGVKGVIASYLSDCQFLDCSSLDSPIAYHFFGIVNSDIGELTAHNSIAGGGTANDIMVHYLVGGYSANFGYLGANASIRMKRCRGFTVPSGYTNSIGFRLFGYIADTFVTDYEMSLMQYGIEIDGRDASGTIIPNSAGVGGQTQDIFFTNAICDGTGLASVHVHDLNGFADIAFNDLYAAPSSAANNFGVKCSTTLGGRVSFIGGKILCSTNNCTGMSFDTMNSVSVEGTFIRDAAIPLVANAVGVSNLSPSIYQLSGSATAGVTLTGCFRSRCYPQITGADATVGRGVQMDSSSTQIEVNCTAINPGCFTTVSGDNKVWYDGAAVVTATTSFGTGNLKSGALT